MKTSILIQFVAISLLVMACSPTRTQSNLESKTSEESALSPSKHTQFNYVNPAMAEGPRHLQQVRYGFAIQAPDTSWVLVSDPSLDSGPVEFFHPQSGTRIVISSDLLDEESTANVADLVAAEMQNHEGIADKMDYSNSRPMELGLLNGMGWETAWNRLGSHHHSMGFIAMAGKVLFKAQLSSVSENPVAKEDVSQRWNTFFSGLALDPSLKSNSSALSPHYIQKVNSQEFGFSWTSPDTLWHEWVGMGSGDTDPEFSLMDHQEEVSLFMYGARTNPQDITAADLFKVFLMRLGLPHNSDQLITEKLRMTDLSVQAKSFEIIHSVNGFDFIYRGRYYWKDGRGVLIASWTQYALLEKYKQVMERALLGLKFQADSPQSEISIRKSARLLNQVGLLRLAEEQPLVALGYFEKANRSDPSEPLYLINCGFVYQLKNLYGPGTSHFLTQMNLVNKSGKLLHILGEMYESLRDYGQALKYYEQAAKYSPNDPELMINLSDALWGVGQRNQSLDVVKNLYSKQPSVRLGVYVSKTLMGMDQYAESVDFLYEVRSKFPMTRDLGLTLCDALVFLQRYQEALEISQELMPHYGDDWEFLTARGKILFHLKQYVAAETTLLKALKLKPDNEDVKSYLSASKAFLGKADIRALQASIEPARPRPSVLKSYVDSVFAVTSKEEGAPAVIHWQSEILKAHKNGSWVRTEEMIVEILAPRGTALFQEFSYSFLPGYDRIFVNALEVYSPQWKLKNRWTVQQAYITYFKEEGSGADAQLAHFPLTNLQVGDLIYLQVSRTSIENSGTIPYTHHKSSREIPVRRDEFRLLVPDTNRFVTEDYGPIERTPIEGGILWSAEFPTTIRKEVFMPIYRDFGAGVLVAAKQQWQQVGKDYLTLIRHQFKNSIPVREKAFEIKGNRKLDQETIYLTADWIRNNIKYREVAFGGHSLIPTLSLATLNNRNGDCKDQSLLLLEMLNALGVTAHLALIHLEEPGSEALPTIQQFNHMIVYIPATKDWPEMWLDPTDQSSGRRPIPLDLEGKVSLILKNENPYVHVAPILEKDQEHIAHIGHRIFIGAQGEAEFRDSLSLQGKFASLLRNEMLSRDESERKQYFLDWLVQSLPDVSLTGIKVGNVNHFDKPLTLVITYASSHYFSRGANDVQGPIPSLWEHSFMRLPKVKRRHHPLRLPHETQFTYSLQVMAPDGKRVEIQSKVDKKTSTYTQSEFSPPKKTGNGLNVTGAWKTHAVYADPSEYEAIRKEWDDILQATSPHIKLVED